MNAISQPRETVGKTVENGQSTRPHLPLLTKYCEWCHHPFPTVSQKARHCSDECRVDHWQAEKRWGAMVQSLLDFFEIADSERRKLARIVRRHDEAFSRLMDWLGFYYHRKTYTWRHQAA